MNNAKTMYKELVAYFIGMGYVKSMAETCAKQEMKRLGIPLAM